MLTTKTLRLSVDASSARAVVETDLGSHGLEVTWTGDWTAEAESGSRKLNFFFADGAPYLKVGVHFYSLSSTDTSVQIDQLSRGITTAYGAWRGRRVGSIPYQIDGRGLCVKGLAGLARGSTGCLTRRSSKPAIRDTERSNVGVEHPDHSTTFRAVDDLDQNRCFLSTDILGVY